MSQEAVNDPNLVAIWLRKDVTRWIAGVLGGAFAGLVSMAFAMVLSVILGAELWFPVKVPALPFLGAEALEFGNTSAVILGLIVWEIFTAFWGFVYAHFTGTNHLPALLGVGLAWGLFLWIFWMNLFLPSFRDFYAAGIPSGAMFFVALVYGLSLTAVASFDRLLRGKK